MKIEVNITKTKFFVLLIAIFAISGMIFVFAYNSPGVPSNFGHSLNEVNGPNCESDQALTHTSSGWNCIDLSASGSSDIITNVSSRIYLPSNKNYTLDIMGTYFTCYDYASSLTLDGNVVGNYNGLGTNGEGCDQNTIIVHLNNISGNHVLNMSQLGASCAESGLYISQCKYFWIARAN